MEERVRSLYFPEAIASCYNVQANLKGVRFLKKIKSKLAFSYFILNV